MKQIPKTFKLNGREYRVLDIPNPSVVKGTTAPKEAVIYVAICDLRGQKFFASERYQTFWHELTHCIVWEMDYNKPIAGWRDEPWVSKFSKLLNEAITTARF